MTTTTETIPEWKREEVAALEEILAEATSVGIVDVTGIPSRQLQTMRREIRDAATLRISRNTLVERALSSIDEGLEELTPYVSGPIGLIMTDENPFSLYQKLEASKTAAPIGAGEVAPNDIVIEAGDTGIDPGPFVGELQNVGAPARIEDGSIQITETSTVCEAGEEVSADLAAVLNELGLEPKEVGLDLRAVFADGVVFEADDLELDPTQYEADIGAASTRAHQLAMAVSYPADGIQDRLLAQANAKARHLAVAAGIVEPGAAGEVLAAAQGDALGLAGSIDDEEAMPSDAIPTTAETEPTTETDQQATQSTEDAESEPETDDEPADEADDDDEADAEGLGDLFG